MKNVKDFNSFLNEKNISKKDTKKFYDKVISYLKSIDAVEKEKKEDRVVYELELGDKLKLEVILHIDDSSVYSIFARFNDVKEAVDKYSDIIKGRVNSYSGKFNFHGADGEELLKDFKNEIFKNI